ncbi:hypothetical protein K432DRAFT_401130 [Lepidopterella palustris CBS 459.81]|uniref:Uncharacterized protein n=1 Tax=Lepidopterella palustris CBS 459.81 TaxID=1314670 RepID=A0A8E2EIH8_9PEZI|nr:hypothetical protein K432DRAFT_401130 [Lepidopterella palustris CBS 459.81]
MSGAKTNLLDKVVTHGDILDDMESFETLEEHMDGAIPNDVEQKMMDFTLHDEVEIDEDFSDDELAGINSQIKHLESVLRGDGVFYFDDYTRFIIGYNLLVRKILDDETTVSNTLSNVTNKVICKVGLSPTQPIDVVIVHAIVGGDLSGRYRENGQYSRSSQKGMET